MHKVYDAFTDEKLLNKWFTSKCKVDLREGGQYSNGDGDEGVYLEIIPNKKLCFTWDNKDHCPGSMVKIGFETGKDKGTKITLIHDKLKSEEDVQHMRTGWEWALDSLKAFLETGKAMPFEIWLMNRNANLNLYVK